MKHLPILSLLAFAACIGLVEAGPTGTNGLEYLQTQTEILGDNGHYYSAPEDHYSAPADNFSPADNTAYQLAIPSTPVSGGSYSIPTSTPTPVASVSGNCPSGTRKDSSGCCCLNN